MFGWLTASLDKHEEETRGSRTEAVGSYLLVAGTRILGVAACFSAISKHGPFSLMALGFLQPGIWWKVQTTPVLVQDRYRIVRRLLSLRAVCFYNRLGPFYVSKVKFIWKLVSPGRVSHFSSRDSSAHGCQGVSLGASLPGNLPLYS